MAEPCITTSRRSMLGLLAATAVAGVPTSALSAVDRSAWEEVVRDHATAEAAATLVGQQADAALGAFVAESPEKPPLLHHVPITRHDGTTMLFPCEFISEKELRGKCSFDETGLGSAFDEARKVLIPQWDAWHAKRDELKRKHRVTELERAADAAWEKAYAAEARLMNTPAPDLAAVLHKLTMVWGENGKCDRGDEEDKLAILADLRRLAKVTH